MWGHCAEVSSLFAVLGVVDRKWGNNAQPCSNHDELWLRFNNSGIPGVAHWFLGQYFLPLR